MKKRVYLLLILVVCAAMVLTVLPVPAAAEKVVFLSVNDLLPPELANCVTYYGGSAYVPCKVFSNYGLGVGYSYFNDASTAYLYTNSLDLFFDIPNARCYDSEDYQYSAAAIYYGGTVYVPLIFTAAFFGIGVSYIQGNEYGSIYRLCNGAQVLDDAEFLNAATRIMQDVSQRLGTPAPTATPSESPEPSPSGTPAPSATPRPTPSPTPSPEVSHAEDTLRLSFLGLPDAEVLDALDAAGLRGCVFVTAQDVKTRADDVRRLVCGGWRIGVCCGKGGAADYSEIAPLLFDAARVKTALVSSEPEHADICRTAAERRDLVYVEPDLDAREIDAKRPASDPVVRTLDAGGDHVLRLSGSAEEIEGLDALLRFVGKGGFRVEVLRETGA